MSFFDSEHNLIIRSYWSYRSGIGFGSCVMSVTLTYKRTVCTNVNVDNTHNIIKNNGTYLFILYLGTYRNNILRVETQPMRRFNLELKWLTSMKLMKCFIESRIESRGEVLRTVLYVTNFLTFLRTLGRNIK